MSACPTRKTIINYIYGRGKVQLHINLWERETLNSKTEPPLNNGYLEIAEFFFLRRRVGLRIELEKSRNNRNASRQEAPGAH